MNYDLLDGAVVEFEDQIIRAGSIFQYTNNSGVLNVNDTGYFAVTFGIAPANFNGLAVPLFDLTINNAPVANGTQQLTGQCGVSYPPEDDFRLTQITTVIEITTNPSSIRVVNETGVTLEINNNFAESNDVDVGVAAYLYIQKLSDL
ncbi:MAG: hypothetical protein S4CHLAM2_04470 [Chlamydiales bacterium]|nr:hypothetical protein [Chlamydiales bacterium]